MDRPTSSSSSNCRSSSGISSTHNSWCSEESVPPPPTPFDHQSPVYDEDDDDDEYEFFYTNPCADFEAPEPPPITAFPSVPTSPLVGSCPAGDLCSSSTSYSDTELKQTYDLVRSENPEISHNISAEESWGILHNVSIQGHTIEFSGDETPCKESGGFAQCSLPLTPINHYFEVKLLGPSQHSFVSVGLTHKNYDKNEMPGCCTGSIAYDANDGKLFAGFEIGSPFGSSCTINDTIGCGIVFPPNAKSSTWCLQNDYSNASDNSSDDDGATTKVISEKVKVFFLMNRNLIGMKEVVVPRHGFYATIAFKQLNERVSVDLHPLTG